MTDEVRRLADAVLYEGHVLWPYRRSSVKNRQRWTFGGVYPRTYAEQSSDRFAVQTECLLEGACPELEVEVRFLHALHRQAAAGDAREPIDELDGYLTWDETTERTVRLSGVGPKQARSEVIAVAAGEAIEPLRDGALVRTWEAVEGTVDARLDRISEGLYRARVLVRNTSTFPSADRDSAIRRSMLSAHAVLRVRSGQFVSATDPPEVLRGATAALRNEGLWPVLVGEEGAREAMLASPIILADYARVAPESPGDFFDGGEIDQLLVLNILGLTDDEKRELRAGDPRAREVLERTEAMTPEQLLRLNGAFRELRPAAGP
jgi:hypothetical protein